MQRLLIILVGLTAGAVVYYAMMALLLFLVSDVFDFSVSSADSRSLVILVLLKLVPLICAMLTFGLITYLSFRQDSRKGDNPAS